MKKILSFVLVLVFTIQIIGCSDNSIANNQKTTDDISVEQGTKQEPHSNYIPPQPFKVQNLDEAKRVCCRACSAGFRSRLSPPKERDGFVPSLFFCGERVRTAAQTV